MNSLSQKLQSDEVIIIDGGVGTELERRGVEMRANSWCSGGAMTNPDVLQQIHQDYIDVGAELIVANTFACSRHLLARSGLEDQFEALNRDGLRLALAARDAASNPNAVVAGSIATTPQGGPQPPLDVAYVNYADQAKIQQDAGAELLNLEMMRDIPHTRAALEGAKATGLPIWMGYACVLVDGVPHLYEDGGPLADALSDIKGEPIDVLSIMHTETSDIDACLDVVEQYWDGPVGVYSQTGAWEQPNWSFIDTISPEDYAVLCQGWVARGVRVLGGCCGIGPEHIAQLRATL